MVHFKLAAEESSQAQSHILGQPKRLTVINDGEEFFLMNVGQDLNDAYKRTYDDSYALDIIKSYLQSNGRYVCYNGVESPFQLLEKMIEWETPFSTHHGCNLSVAKCDVAGTRYIVYGNLEHVSSAFRYVFFCKDTLDGWISKAKIIDPNSNFDY